MEFDEQSLIPFQPSRLDGESIVVLAPHPDDEVIGCGGFLALASSEGRQIHVIVVTDGGAATESRSPESSKTKADPDTSSYASRRRSESKEGLGLLGIDQVEFLDLPDRGLASRFPELVELLAGRIDQLSPDLILAPAPFDIHPDHHLVARALWEVFQDRNRARAMRDVSVAFYETSQPLPPDVLVDISSVIGTKLEAIRVHGSQTEIRDYAGFSEGLARYRALTLPAEVTHAEAYRRVTVRELGVQPWSGFTESVRPALPPSITVQREPLPITVVIRTRNRPDLLREALDSVRRSEYECKAVVVNDGGQTVAGVVGEALPEARVIEHESSRGRAGAANRGVEEATTAFVSFLDDDDLHYPEHLGTLAAHWSSDHIAVYSDAVSTFLGRDDEGMWRRRDSMRTYTQPFDRELLLVDNYIPLPTLLLRRADILDAGGFDTSFDLFEDWELLIRLARRGTFRHIPRVTCEIRHFEGGDSAVLGAPEGSAAFRQAKKRVWELHRDAIDDDVLLDVYERQKRRARELDDRLMNEMGRARRLETDLRRVSREAAEVSVRLGQEHERASAAAHELGGRLQQSEKALAESREVIGRASADIRSLQERILVLEEQVRERERVIDERDETLEAHFHEIRRLNGILEQIYASRSWRLHLMAEKLKGR